MLFTHSRIYLLVMNKYPSTSVQTIYIKVNHVTKHTKRTSGNLPAMVGAKIWKRDYSELLVALERSACFELAFVFGGGWGCRKLNSFKSTEWVVVCKLWNRDQARLHMRMARSWYCEQVGQAPCCSIDLQSVSTPVFWSVSKRKLWPIQSFVFKEEIVLFRRGRWKVLCLLLPRSTVWGDSQYFKTHLFLIEIRNFHFLH